MISERPVLGWGLQQTYQKLGQSVGGREYTGTHNTYLMILATTGIVGAVPFTIFFVYPFVKYRSQRDNDLYKQLLVLLIFVMLVFMSLDWLNRKQYWIIYSMILAELELQRTPLMLRIRR
jgi:O-antigen ligase